MERGRMLSRRFSAFACSCRSAPSASRRWLANTASSVNTMVPPTAMFRASIVLVNQPGSGRQIGSMSSPAIPDPRNTTRYATYQRAADPTSLNTSAPSGARIPQRPTPPEARNPPSGIIDSVGASRMSTWPTRSSHGKSRVRENTAIAPSRMPKYTRGTTPTGDPNARYSAPQSAATGRINTEIRTSSAFRARRSSSSLGSAPTSARRALTRPAAVRIRSRRRIAGDVTRGAVSSRAARAHRSALAEQRDVKRFVEGLRSAAFVRVHAEEPRVVAERPIGAPPLELAALKNGKAPPELSSDGDPVVLAVDPALQERDRCFRPQPGMEVAVWSWHRETADRPL